MLLGLDISKATFDAALAEDQKKPRHKRFANTAAGFEQLAAWLGDNGATQVRACLEATGTYGEALALLLVQQGHTVSIVNPAAIHDFAKSQLSCTKTDKADAQLIARFCQERRPVFPQLVRKHFAFWLKITASLGYAIDCVALASLRSQRF